MGLKDKLALTKSNIEYTRPQQLPVKVAFHIKKGEICVNKLKANEDSRRVFLKYTSSVDLMVYLPSKFSLLSAEDMTEFAVEEMYLVSRGVVASEKVNLDILSKAEVAAEDGLVIFNSSVHSLNVDSPSKSGGSSGSFSDTPPKMAKLG